MGLATVGKLASLTASYYPDGTAATWYLRRVDWGANAVFCLEIVARLVLRNTAADRVWCLVVCPWAAAYWGLLYAEARVTGHGVSVAQVCLRWILQHGAALAVGLGANATTIPAYAATNLDLYSFELADAEMALLDAK